MRNGKGKWAITVENIEEYLRTLESAPFIASRDLLCYLDYAKPLSITRQREYVPVAKIISAPIIENWGAVKDHRRTNAYLVAMVDALHTGRLNLESEPPQLQEYGGAYLVTSDGITRCAVAKLLGVQRIPAEVEHVHASLACRASTKDGYNILLARQAAGLWQGNLTVYYSSKSLFRRFLRATGEVTDYEGVWVFAKSMEKAKKIYQTVGAIGKE
jgi:hypothetical protein